MRGSGIRGITAELFTVTHSLTGGTNGNSVEAFSVIFRNGNDNQFYEPLPNHMAYSPADVP